MAYSIVLITDNNYVKPTLVAISSIAFNKKDDTCYDIYLLTNNLTEENIDILKTCESETIKIKIINKCEIVENFKNIKVRRHVSTTAILKFYIPEIFNNLDKILYLDGDILVQKDLSELFKIDLGEYYAAVVKDTLSVVYPKHMKEYKIYNDFYFNSGVMLLNIDKMRKDGVKEKLVEYKRKIETPFMDQDALNAIIGGNVKYISYRYNFLNYYTEVLTLGELEKFFNEKLKDNIKDVYSDCVILHLGGKEKPWKYEMEYLSDLYNSYYNRTILKDVPLKLEPLSQKRIKKSLLEMIFSIKNFENRKILTILGVQIKFKRKNK